MADQRSASQNDSSKDELVLVTRKEGWGLPTACPVCLPVFLYLRMAELNFSLLYNNRRPDSDDLPIVECGDMAAFSSDTGGVVAFLRDQGITDLDAGFTSTELAQLRSLSAMVESCLQGLLLLELWDTSNTKVANQIYFSEISWPINKILHFKQRARIVQMLQLKSPHWEAKVEELYSRASKSYESLSVVLGRDMFFLKTRPSSLDALFLSHVLFILHVPLENSRLKEELLKHENLIKYSKNLQNNYINGHLPPIAAVFSASSRPVHASSYFYKKPKEKPRIRSEKEKMLKRRAKYFVAAQFGAILVFVLIWGITSDANLLEDENVDGDE